MARVDGFFPGFFDSDGRPWEHAVSNYQRGVETALKIALLTQHHLYLPAGYILDNPCLQRIFLKYRGDATEAKCFRLLMRDLIKICLYAGDSSDRITNWDEVLRDWITGVGSHRTKMVSLNSVDPDTSTHIMRSTDENDFVRQMTQAMRHRHGWNIDLADSITALNNLQFSSEKLSQKFAFDRLMRHGLSVGKERFPELREARQEKVLTIMDAARDAGVEMTRTLFKDPEYCQELGVRGYLT